MWQRLKKIAFGFLWFIALCFGTTVFFGMIAANIAAIKDPLNAIPVAEAATAKSVHLLFPFIFTGSLIVAFVGTATGILPGTKAKHLENLHVWHSKFPFALVFRWLIAAIFFIDGIFRLVLLTKSWSYLAELALNETRVNPWLMIISPCLSIVAGFLLSVRNRWALFAFIAHLVSTVYTLQWLSDIPLSTSFFLAFEAVFILFCLHQSTKGRILGGLTKGSN